MSFLCQVPKDNHIAHKDWLDVTATVEVKHHPLYQGTGPVLTAVSFGPASAPAQDNLTEPQKRIFALLEREEMRFEELAEKTGLTPDQLSGELTMMELDGLIEARAGRAYALKC